MEQSDAAILEALATGAINLFQQAPLQAFLSLCALAASFIVAMFITRRLKRLRPVTSRIRIVIDYLSTIVFGILILLGLMRMFGATLANALLIVAGGMLGLFLVARVIGAIVELLFKPNDPFRSILRTSSVLSWFAAVIYLFGQWNPMVNSFFEASVSIGDARVSVGAVLNTLFLGAIIIILAMWISQILQRYLHKSSGLQPNLALALERIASVIVWVVAALVVVSWSGINLTALAAFGGALGIGLGLGLQRLAASYISGLIVLFERSVRIGDNLISDKIVGKVTQMNIRYTTIHTTDGLDVLVPNDTLINSTIFNETLSNNNIRLEFPITVSADSDLKTARAIFLAAVQKQPRVVKDPPARVYTASVENSGIKLLTRFWINDPSNGRIDIISDINEMVLDEFKKKKISLA